MTSPLTSLIESGTKLWLDSIDPDLTEKSRAMGATGATTVCALEHYFEHYGRPGKILLMPMICTPEFLRAVLDFDENIKIHAGRIDRGLSPRDVLECTPGERWDEERGLDDTNYIVPGAGGVGELLNNSWC